METTMVYWGYTGNWKRIGNYYVIWEQASTEGRMWVRKQRNCKYSKKQAVPMSNPYAASDITAATVEGLCKHVLHCPSFEKISPAWVQER